MRIDIVTIFPEYFGPLRVSLIGKAAARGDIEFYVHDLRQWAHDPHRTVDDTPFGGGPGMVMKPEVWGEALDEIAPPALPAAPAAPADSRLGPGPRLIVPTPSGVPFNQARAVRYTGAGQLVFACGRYEGIDARFIDEARSRMPVDEVSIGDYVLAGGEAAVLVMVEAISRLLPGVLGNDRSASDDSFGGRAAGEDAPFPESAPGGALVPDLGVFGRGRGDEAASMAGLLEGPVYTRPRVWRGREVPDVLLSGDHAAIARWRRDAALLRTAANRPDLIFRASSDPAALSERDWQVLTAMGLSGMLRPAGPGPGEAARLPGRWQTMAH
ncbi:MAG TPA: tRNA (guanine(37)-N(1))-methyltransferase [Streptosporangiaceae bacterium]